ncbi:MAG: DUF4202 domain-containing protein [Myxococcota bacterium]|nr:DUF4202 domain-containing protein [Myxococcota bacterium]
MGEDRLRDALDAIDARNQGDPNQIFVRGATRPKELAHAELATEWVERLVEDPSDELRLAARSHHLRRWAISRSEYPAGRGGYHRWRKALQRLHADEVGAILENEGYAEPTVARVRALVRKQGLERGDDPEVQALEDALCLVFLETQLASTAAKLGDPEKTVDVLRKTAHKMSARALELAGELPLSEAERALLERALR